MQTLGKAAIARPKPTTSSKDVLPAQVIEAAHSSSSSSIDWDDYNPEYFDLKPQTVGTSGGKASGVVKPSRKRSSSVRFLLSKQFDNESEDDIELKFDSEDEEEPEGSDIENCSTCSQKELLDIAQNHSDAFVPSATIYEPSSVFGKSRSIKPAPVAAPPANRTRIYGFKLSEVAARTYNMPVDQASKPEESAEDKPDFGQSSMATSHPSPDQKLYVKPSDRPFGFMDKLQLMDSPAGFGEGQKAPLNKRRLMALQDTHSTLREDDIFT